MPCLNEEDRILGALESLIDDWVLAEGEILVLDGGSSDGTRLAVEEFVKKRRASGSAIQLKIIENPGRLQVFGLNAGIRAACGEFIVRADAHCLFPPGYVKTCIDTIQAKEPEGVANVGGVMEPLGLKLRQKAIAQAMIHPLGVGDARFHLGTKSGFTDTVYLGTFRKRLLEEVGLYDIKHNPNEDAELNIRLLKAGWKIYLDHNLRVQYFPRETYSALARQYFAYGSGRARTTWKHRRVTSWRQIVPAVFVLGLMASLLLAIFKPLFLFFPAAYFGVVLLGAIFVPAARQNRRPVLMVRFAAAWAIVVMHISWGIGFDLEILHLAFGRRD